MLVPAEPLRIRVRSWLQARLPVAAAHELLAHKTVPLHRHSLWYYLGGIILTCFLTLIITGSLLVLYYRPDVPRDPRAPGAYESVQNLVTAIPHGWWIRSIHHWAANTMVMAVLIHLFSVLLLKAYRRPREFTWWTGLVLLGLTMTSAFTGYLLPWNDLSFAATRVGGGIAGAVPLAGPFIRQLLLAGPDVTELTLPRFFGLHVVILPMTIGLVIALHVVLIACHGSSVPPSAERDRAAGRSFASIRFWPDFALRDARVFVLLLGALATVAYVLPPGTGTRADPLAPTPEGIQPEWYFLSVYKVLKMMPAHVLGLEGLQFGVILFGVIGLMLAALPLLDAPPDESAPQRRRAAWLRRLLLAVAAALACAASLPPLLEALDARTTAGLTAWARLGAIAAVAAAWLLVGLWLDRTAERRPNGAATLFGMTLTSGAIGYTLWGGVGAAPALVALALFWAVLLLTMAAGRSDACKASHRTRWPALLLLVALLGGTIPLGRAHEHLGAPDETSVRAVHAKTPVAPAARRDESRKRLVALLVALMFLLAALQRRLRLQEHMHDAGATP